VDQELTALLAWLHRQVSHPRSDIHSKVRIAVQAFPEFVKITF
jgi:hypothetical protein